MPELSTYDAAERLAKVVERMVREDELAEIHDELFPEEPAVTPPTAADLARYIREELEPEEIVDLWNVIFPAHRNVGYDEETGKIHYDERTAEYVDSDWV